MKIRMLVLAAFAALALIACGGGKKEEIEGRVKAIRTAAELKMQTRLSINFLPNAIYRPEVCIRTTLEASNADYRASRASYAAEGGADAVS